MNRRSKIIGIILALALPIIGIPFVRWYIGEMKLSREKNRPHAPAKMYAQGTKEIVNIYGEKEMDSVYHAIPDLKLETQSGDSLELDSLRGAVLARRDNDLAVCQRKHGLKEIAQVDAVALQTGHATRAQRNVAVLQR